MYNNCSSVTSGILKTIKKKQNAIENIEIFSKINCWSLKW